MDSRKPQNSQYHEYEAPNVVPMSSRPTPISTFLGSLRSLGVPEPMIDQARTGLSSVGVTDGAINDLVESVDRKTRKTVDWSKKNPREAAGGFAAIVLAFGLLLILLERRR